MILHEFGIIFNIIYLTFITPTPEVIIEIFIFSRYSIPVTPQEISIVSWAPTKEPLEKWINLNTKYLWLSGFYVWYFNHDLNFYQMCQDDMRYCLWLHKG